MLRDRMVCSMVTALQHGHRLPRHDDRVGAQVRRRPVRARSPDDDREVIGGS
jgi:hypothetical protein